jgi:hypothetical protein
MFPLKEKLYMMAKDHESLEAAQLVELVENDADIPDICQAKDDFLDLLALNNQITAEEYDELSELDPDFEEDDVLAFTEEDDIPEPLHD